MTPVPGPTTLRGPRRPWSSPSSRTTPAGGSRRRSRSIAAQDYPNISVLVVDAASADAAVLRGPGGGRAADGPPPPTRHRPWLRHRGRRGPRRGAGRRVPPALPRRRAPGPRHRPPDGRGGLPVQRRRGRPQARALGRRRRSAVAVGMGSDRYGQPVALRRAGRPRPVPARCRPRRLLRPRRGHPRAGRPLRGPRVASTGRSPSTATISTSCWRAHVAGARVIVAPAARVAHLEALGVRRPVDDRRRLQQRHRLRAMRTSTDASAPASAPPRSRCCSRSWRSCSPSLLGRLRHARDIGLGVALERRATAVGPASSPTTSRPSARPPTATSARSRAGGAPACRPSSGPSSAATTAAAATSCLEHPGPPRPPPRSWCGRLIVVFLLLGSRELLFGRGDIPAVGDFQPFLGPGQMLSRWISGFQTVGLGSTAPAPTGFGIFGGLGVVFLGAVGVLRKVLILGLWPVGAIGMWRFTKPVGSRRARIVATVAYVIVPSARQRHGRGPVGRPRRLRGGARGCSASWPRPSRVAPFGDLGGSAGPGVRSRPLAAPRGRRRCPHAPWPPPSSPPSCWSWSDAPSRSCSVGCSPARPLALVGCWLVGVGGALVGRGAAAARGASRPPTAGRPWSG